MKTIIIISVFALCTIACFGKDPGAGTSRSGINTAPSTEVFRSSYGTLTGISNFSGSCIQQTSDGGFISTGYTSTFGAGNNDIYLLKTTSIGTIQWTKIFGSPYADNGNFVVQTSDGGYAIAGVTNSTGGEYISLIKTDPSGTLTWSKVYGSATSGSDASAASLLQTSDGGFILAGYTSNYGAGSDDFYLLKTDMNGNIVWTKTYGGGMNDDAYAVAQTYDGGFIIAGTTSSFGNSMGDILLVRTDANGVVLWAKTYDSNLTDAMESGLSVNETGDHGYIIAGSLTSSSDGVNAVLIRTDMNGTIQWANVFNNEADGSDMIFTSARQLADGGVIATGYIDDFTSGYDQFFLVRTGTAGNLLWTKTYGSDAMDIANYVDQAGDGGYILAGLTTASPGNKYLSVVKTDTGGNTSCNVFVSSISLRTDITINAQDMMPVVSTGGMAHTASVATTSGGVQLNVCGFFGIGNLTNQDNKVTAFPNPSSSNVTIQLADEVPNPVLMIYDIAGTLVLQTTFTGEQIVLDRSDLPSGMYFYRVLNNNDLVGSGKIIME